jgi:hypothetical protein
MKTLRQFIATLVLCLGIGAYGTMPRVGAMDSPTTEKGGMKIQMMHQQPTQKLKRVTVDGRRADPGTP